MFFALPLIALSAFSWLPPQVNTERTIHKGVGIRHTEGGWPENVDSTEIDQVDRFLKKAVKVRTPSRDYLTHGLVADGLPAV